MKRARTTWIVLFAFGLLAVAAAPFYHSATRPKLLCWIPDRDYQFKSFAPPVRALSATGVLIRQPLTEEGEKQVAIRSFQFVETPRLEIDHCSISEMAVQLRADGYWTVNLRAEQNAVDRDVERKVTTIERPVDYTRFLLRNQFYVNVRCFGRYGETGADGLLGKPVMVPIRIQPFWVQRGIPLPLRKFGNDTRIANYFDLIDRVEIEFTYRKP